MRSSPYFYIPTCPVNFASKKDNMTVKSAPSGTCFLQNIRDLDILTSMSRVLVTITIGDSAVYDEYLYPADGEVLLADLADIYRPYARQQLVVDSVITVTEQKVTSTDDSDEVTQSDQKTLKLRILYATVDIPDIDCQDFTDTHFLTILQDAKTTAMGRLEYLHYLGTDAATVTAYYTDGSKQLLTAEVVGGNGKYTTIDVSPSKFAVKGKQLSYFDVKAGARLQTFIVDTEQPDCAPILLFTNSFGCQELIYCTGKHEVAPEYTRDSASIGGRTINYRITEKRIFKGDTGPLTTAMAAWADELFRSDEVYVVNIYGGEPVVGKQVTISDSKSDNDNLLGTVPRFTFSYVYSQRQHNVLDMQRAGRVFDNTFDNTFN